MFFILPLQHEILLHPEHFGPTLKTTLKNKLHEEVEGTCQGRHGFIIAVQRVIDISDGRILPGRGHALFVIKYKALVFRPFVGEVVDAIVSGVIEAGIVAEVGPLSVFISNHWIPDNFVFDRSSHPPRYKSKDESESIQADDSIRLRIGAVRIEANEIHATGNLADNYLGVILS
eukprot:m.78619 g.78619  ORF g.78619 m.78619 type:complete len:174 (-) comp14757_c0_seq3:2106-2627(-)